MTAEMLREAAALMRSRAMNAGLDTWGVTPGRGYDGTSQVSAGTSHVVAHYVHAHDREHIVGMQPAVALLIAAWLDDVATHWEVVGDEWADDDGDPIEPEGTIDGHHAATVARTYLGRDA